MDFLNAFQQAYGGGSGAPGTMREILSAAQAWLQGEAGPEPLLEGLDSMAGKALRNQASNEDDLLKNPRLDPELREALALSAERFGELAAGLGQLAEAIHAGDPGPVPDLLVFLEDTAVDLGQLGQAMRAWLEAPGARCPKCGSRGPEGRCPGCSLDRLVPDPVHLMDRSRRTAVLPAGFPTVYKAYTGVLEGRKTVGELFATLDAFEEAMRTTRARAELLAREGSGSAATLIATVDEVVQGVEQMRQVAETRAMRDLHQGWQRILSAGARLESDTADVLEEGGRGEQASQFHHVRRITDVVHLEGD